MLRRGLCLTRKTRVKLSSLHHEKSTTISKDGGLWDSLTHIQLLGSKGDFRSIGSYLVEVKYIHEIFLEGLKQLGLSGSTSSSPKKGFPHHSKSNLPITHIIDTLIHHKSSVIWDVLSLSQKNVILAKEIGVNRLLQACLDISESENNQLGIHWSMEKKSSIDSLFPILSSLIHTPENQGSQLKRFANPPMVLLAENFASWIINDESFQHPSHIRAIILKLTTISKLNQETNDGKPTASLDYSKEYYYLEDFLFHLLKSINQNLHKNGIISVPEYFNLSSNSTNNSKFAGSSATLSPQSKTYNHVLDPMSVNGQVLFYGIKGLKELKRYDAIYRLLKEIQKSDLNGPSQPIRLPIKLFQYLCVELCKDIPVTGKLPDYMQHFKSGTERSVPGKSRGFLNDDEGSLSSLDMLFTLIEGLDEWSYESRQHFFHVLITQQRHNLLFRYTRRCSRNRIPLSRNVFHELISHYGHTQNGSPAAYDTLRALRKQGKIEIPNSFRQSNPLLKLQAQSLTDPEKDISMAGYEGNSTVSERAKDASTESPLIGSRSIRYEKFFDGPDLNTYRLFYRIASSSTAEQDYRQLLVNLREDNVKPDFSLLKDILQDLSGLQDNSLSKDMMEVIYRDTQIRAIHFGERLWQPPTLVPGIPYFEKNVVSVQKKRRESDDSDRDVVIGNIQSQSVVRSTASTDLKLSFRMPDLNAEQYDSLYFEATLTARKQVNGDDALRYLSELKSLGIKPSAQVFKNVMRCLIHCQRPQEVIGLYEDMLKLRVQRDLRHASLFVQALAANGRVRDAYGALMSMEKDGSSLFIEAYRTVASKLLIAAAETASNEGLTSPSGLTAETSSEYVANIVESIVEKKDKEIATSFLHEIEIFASKHSDLGKHMALKLREHNKASLKDLADVIDRAARQGLWINASADLSMYISDAHEDEVEYDDNKARS